MFSTLCFFDKPMLAGCFAVLVGLFAFIVCFKFI